MKKNPHINHPFSIDLEDWYQGIELPLEEWAGKEVRLDYGMSIIIDMLEETHTKCTFFTLGWIGERYPKLIKKLADAGHEIASHGYSHIKVYQMSPQAFKEELIKTKKILEDVSGQNVIGHRSPFFSITEKSLWALEILAECGFKYDCSITPIKTWRYGIKDSPESIYKFKEFDLIEFPMNTFSLLGKKFGVGGAYFRIFPYFLFEKAYTRNSERLLPTMFYAHPWEYDPEHPVVNFEIKAKITHYTNLKSMHPKTLKLLNDFQFSTVKSVIEQAKATNNIQEISWHNLKRPII